MNAQTNRNRRRLIRAVLLLGLGLGGFVDGIVLHQLLQWHQMVSIRVPPVTLAAKNYNMFWDGVFHAGCWLLTLAGVVQLWQAGQRGDIARLSDSRLLVGGLLSGFGLFNVVEGVLDHHVFRLHSVRDLAPNPLVWNYGFLLLGLLLMAFGYALMRQSRVQPPVA